MHTLSVLMAFKVVILSLLLCCCSVLSKVYDRCELARELKNVHKFPEEQIATWVCIARHESEFNTSAVGHLNWDGSGDHGLFQISDLFWCSPPGKGWACGVTCAQLEDDDIADDVACVKRIYRQHQRLTGDGFSAWAVYSAHCTAGSVSQYVENCSDATTTAEPEVDNELVKTEDTEVIVGDKVVELDIEIVDENEKPNRTPDKASSKLPVVKTTSQDGKPLATTEATTARIQDRISHDDSKIPKPKSSKRYFAKLFEYVYRPS